MIEIVGAGTTAVLTAGDGGAGQWKMPSLSDGKPELRYAGGQLTADDSSFHLCRTLPLWQALHSLQCMSALSGVYRSTC